MMEILAKSARFDSDSFSNAIKEGEENYTLDPVVTWLREREFAHAQDELPPSCHQFPVVHCFDEGQGNFRP